MVPDESKACVGLEYFCFEGDDLWTMSDDDLVKLATRELGQLGLADPSKVEKGYAVRVPKAYPMYDAEYSDRVDVIKDWLAGVENLHQVGRNGLHRYNNSDHSSLTAIRTVENICDGTNHDIWAVNAESSYHEEDTSHKDEFQPYKEDKIPEPPSMEKPLADVGFNRGRQVRERSDSAGQLADRYGGASPPHTFDLAPHFGVPEGQLQPQRHRLRVHTVRATDHRRQTVFEGPVANRVAEGVQIAKDYVARLAHLQSLRCVDHVRRGHAEVHPAGRRPNVLGHRSRERDHVVLGDLFNFFDSGNVEGAALANVARGLLRNDPRRSHRVGGSRLDEQPGLVATLVAPDPAHLRVCVALDHALYPPRKTLMTPRDKPAGVLRSPQGAPFGLILLDPRCRVW